MKSEKRLITCMACFLLAMMVIGSFLDYQISLTLYNPENIFGIVLASFGEMPAALGFVCGGTMLVKGRNRTNQFIGFIQVILGCLCLLSGTAMACITPGAYMNCSTVISVIIGIVLAGITLLGTVQITENAERSTLIRMASTFLIVIFLDILIVNLIKIPWGRARMRLVAVDERAYFMPWWQAGSQLKDQLTALGVASEEFKSFPSGHTANASSIFLITTLPFLIPSLKDRQNTLFVTAFVWTCLVAVSRIIMGAHYLTDTTVGFAVGFTVFVIVKYLFLKRGKKQN